MSEARFVSLDVHSHMIAVAIAEPGGKVRLPGIIPFSLESIRKLIGKLCTANDLNVCYEADRTGHVMQWQLTQFGVA